MKLFNRFALISAVFSMVFIGCTKENDLTLNPEFDPAATGESATTININIGGNTGGNTGGGGGGTTSKITGSEGLVADFNGTEENFEICRFVQSGNTTSISANKFDGTQSVTIAITGNLVAGNSYTFNTDGSVTYQADVPNPSASTVYTSQGGTLTLTSVSSNELIGTFNFTGDNTAQSNPLVVSGGEFKAKK